MAMIRARAAAGSDVDTRLLFSSRNWEDVIGRPEPGRAARRLYLRPTPFVEAVAEALVQLGHEPHRVRTERVGPTGG